MITMLDMPKDAEPKNPEADTVPVTIRMARKRRDDLLAIGAKYPFKLTLTQLIDAACVEYIAAHKGDKIEPTPAPKRSDKR